MTRPKRTTPSVSLKPKQRKYLEKKAEQAGVSLGRYMREVALGRRSPEGQKIGKDHRLRQLLSELSRIGNNVNQIARVANQTHSVNPHRILRIRESMDKITVAIIEEL